MLRFPNSGNCNGCQLGIHATGMIVPEATQCESFHVFLITMPDGRVPEMKVLIFGCGYLGRRVAQKWLDLGHSVFAVTRSEEKSKSLKAAGIQPIVADLNTADSLNYLPEIDLVFNAVGFDRNPGQSQEQVMCDGLRNILDTTRCLRFIHISSTSVYGQSTGEWVDETSSCEPTQPGGQICLKAEQFVREFCSGTSSVSFNILRLAGIYGPGRLLSRIESLKAGMPIAGTGESWLNLIHVDDAADAVVKCSQVDPQNQTFLVVDNRPVRRSEYFGKLAELVGAPLPVFDTDQARPRGSGGLNKRCSNQKVREFLRWEPQFQTIDIGLPASLKE